MLIRAFSDRKWLAMVMAGDSRATVSHGRFEVLTVTSVLLECPSKHGDLLASDATRSDRPFTLSKLYSRVEEGLDDLSRESVLLVLVHLDNSSPVLGDLGQVKRLGQVDQVEDILLETRTTETLRSELIPNPGGGNIRPRP